MGKYNNGLCKYQRSRKYGPHQQIETMFRRQKQIEQAVFEAKNDSRGHTGGGGTGHTYVSDPTAMAAIRSAEELRSVTLDDGFVVRWPERWLRVIVGTYKNCPGDAGALKLRSDGYRWDEACAKLNSIGRTTYFSMLNHADNFALAAACQMGIVNVI